MSKLKADIDAMLAHLHALFDSVPERYRDGLLEIAYTSVKDGVHKLDRAQLFLLDQFDVASKFAAIKSEAGLNVYCGVWLRKPDSFPGGRTNDIDAYCTMAVCVDLDEEGRAANAKNVWGDLPPTHVVMTGKVPHARMQFYYLLDAPLTDHARYRAAQAALCGAFDGDPAIVNTGRVMRLPGSIAWPAKPGRVAELTRIQPLKNRGAPVSLETIEEKYSQFFKSAEVPLAYKPAALSSHETRLLAAPTAHIGQITDGREAYMRDTALACLKQFCMQNGAAPTPFELFDMAWPQYDRNASTHVAGKLDRGQDEMRAMCVKTINRFDAGQISSLPNLDAAVAPRSNVVQLLHKPEQLHAPARRALRSHSFYQLLTEQVEEVPDYIEPNFVGPGGFVVIAGPPKAQKSFLLQEIVASCAVGGQFLNNTFSVPRPLRVFWLQAEMNAKELRKRARVLGGMLTAEQTRLYQENLFVSERFAMILDDNGVDLVVAHIKELFPDSPPDIIAIDPLQNVLDVENENDNAQIMRFLTQRLEAVRQRVNPDAAIILAHHTKKMTAEDMGKDAFIALRGASALRGYYDSCIVIHKASDEGEERRVHFELRSGEAPEPMAVEMVDGRFVTSDPTRNLSVHVARAMLQDLRQAWELRAPLSHFPRAKSELRYVGDLWPKKYNVTSKAALGIVEDWLKNGIVIHRPHVRHRHPAGLEVVGSI